MNILVSKVGETHQGGLCLYFFSFFQVFVCLFVCLFSSFSPHEDSVLRILERGG